MSVDWSPTVAFFLSTGALQLAFAVVLLIRGKRDESTWVIGLIFGINGVLAILRGAYWMDPGDAAARWAAHRTVFAFDQLTNLLILWLVFTYPKPIAWIERNRILARSIAAAIAALFVIPAVLDPVFQPQLGVTKSLFDIIHTTTFRVILEAAFPVLLLRWAFLLPTIKNPAQLRQFRLLFAAFGVRAAHMITTWGTAHVRDGLDPAFWVEHSGPFLPLGIATVLTGILALSAMIIALVHLAWARTRSPTDNQRAVAFVLWFLLFGVLEGFLDLLTLEPLAGSFVALVLSPLALVDVLVLRPILVWAAMVRHQFLGSAARGPASLQAIAFAVSAPAFYGGFLPLLTPASGAAPFTHLTTGLVAVAGAALLAVGVRPLAMSSSTGAAGEMGSQTESDYMAAVEDVYRRGAQDSERDTLDQLRDRLGLAKNRATALEDIVATFWNRMGDIIEWRVGDRVLGRYRIDGVLGRGGMSHCLLCHDELRNQTVVLKRQLNLDEASLSAIHMEGRTLAGMDHRNILKLIRTENLDNESVLVLEYMPGGSLEDQLMEGPMAIKDIKVLAQDMLAALNTAHTRSIIHRDIKPSNILFDRDGVCKLADFGIAQQNRHLDTMVMVTAGATRLMGSFRYMAPEQLDYGQTSERSDLYSLGAVLFDCLHGSAFTEQTHQNAIGTASKRARSKDLSDVPPSLRPLLEALLEPDVNKRVATARAAMALLD